MNISAQDILDFWFVECTPKQWWIKEMSFDETIRQRFLTVHQAAVKGELSGWRKTAEGRLAEIIVLDQFSRNLYRNDPRAWRYDGMALILAQEAIACGDDQRLTAGQTFLYMPFMHSESPLIHEQSIALFSQPGLANNLDFAHKHKIIIDRFGRYPHRNAVLGRESTAEELEFLQQPNSSF
ncbi:DUF924 family protein [Marinicella sp. W31]|uniref:DUF924 family protein n=1 Tax=Marinicella sp. W31 TaxID=3023713 RepID=UPI00375734C5